MTVVTLFLTYQFDLCPIFIDKGFFGVVLSQSSFHTEAFETWVCDLSTHTISH